MFNRNPQTETDRRAALKLASLASDSLAEAGQKATALRWAAIAVRLAVASTIAA